jgi:hypothetical protein
LNRGRRGHVKRFSTRQVARRQAGEMSKYRLCA